MSFSLGQLAMVPFNNITGTAVGNTTIFTTANPEITSFFTLGLIVGETNISGVVTPPTISLGVTAANYIDIIAATALTGSIGGAKYQILQPIAVPQSILSNLDIVVRVSVAAVATTYQFGVMLYGIYGDTAA